VSCVSCCCPTSTISVLSLTHAAGKCRVKFPEGCKLAVKDRLLFRYKRYVFDKTKRMVQTGLDELRAAEDIPTYDVSGNQSGIDLVEESAGKEVGLKDSRKVRAKAGRNVENKPGAAALSDVVTPPEGAQLRPEVGRIDTGAGHPIESQQAAPPSDSSTTLPHLSPSAAAAPAGPTTTAPPVQPASPRTEPVTLGPALAPRQAMPSTVSAVPSAPVSVGTESTSIRVGTIESSKAEESTPEQGPGALIAIVKGAFRMEENVRQYAGCAAACGDVQGQLTAPFGKLGKCKVSFPPGTVCVVGETVSIMLPASR
jgi:hypothetical protein